MDCMDESIDSLWEFILDILLPAYRAFVVVRCSMGRGDGYCYCFSMVVGGILLLGWTVGELYCYS